MTYILLYRYPGHDWSPMRVVDERGIEDMRLELKELRESKESDLHRRGEFKIRGEPNFKVNIGAAFAAAGNETLEEKR